MVFVIFLVLFACGAGGALYMITGSADDLPYWLSKHGKDVMGVVIGLLILLAAVGLVGALATYPR